MLRFMPTHPRETNLSTEPGLRNSAQRRIPPREDWLLERAATRPRSLHDPAVAHDQGLPGEGVRLEGGEKQSRLRNVAKRGEFTVDRVLEHDGLDDGLLRDAYLLRLLRGLLVGGRRHAITVCAGWRGTQRP